MGEGQGVGIRQVYPILLPHGLPLTSSPGGLPTEAPAEGGRAKPQGRGRSPVLYLPCPLLLLGFSGYPSYPCSIPRVS